MQAILIRRGTFSGGFLKHRGNMQVTKQYSIPDGTRNKCVLSLDIAPKANNTSPFISQLQLTTTSVVTISRTHVQEYFYQRWSYRASLHKPSYNKRVLE